jgi:hypothetical protein
VTDVMNCSCLRSAFSNLHSLQHFLVAGGLSGIRVRVRVRVPSARAD